MKKNLLVLAVLVSFVAFKWATTEPYTVAGTPVSDITGKPYSEMKYECFAFDGNVETASCFYVEWGGRAPDYGQLTSFHTEEELEKAVTMYVK